MTKDELKIKLGSLVGTGKPVSDKYLTYGYMSELTDDMLNNGTLNRLTGSLLKSIHDVIYDEETAIDFFAPSKETINIAYIKRNKPIPIHSNGMGDHMCYIVSGKIVEYVHDDLPSFEPKYGMKFSNISQFINYLNSNQANESADSVNFIDLMIANEATTTVQIDDSKKFKIINYIKSGFMKPLKLSNAELSKVNIMITKSSYMIEFFFKYKGKEYQDYQYIDELDQHDCEHDLDKFKEDMASFIRSTCKSEISRGRIWIRWP